MQNSPHIISTENPNFGYILNPSLICIVLFSSVDYYNKEVTRLTRALARYYSIRDDATLASFYSMHNLTLEVKARPWPYSLKGGHDG